MVHILGSGAVWRDVRCVAVVLRLSADLFPGTLLTHRLLAARRAVFTVHAAKRGQPFVLICTCYFYGPSPSHVDEFSREAHDNTACMARDSEFYGSPEGEAQLPAGWRF